MYYCVFAIILLLRAPPSRSSCTYENLDTCYNLIPDKAQKSGITCSDDENILIIDNIGEFQFLSSIVQTFDLHVWLDCTKQSGSTFTCTNGNTYNKSDSFTGYWPWSSDGNTFDFDCVVLHAIPSGTDAFWLSGGSATIKTELCESTFHVICESSLLEEQPTLPITTEGSTTTKPETTYKETTQETTTAKTTSETSTFVSSSDISTEQTTVPITTEGYTTTKSQTTDKETTQGTTTAKTSSETSVSSSDLSTEQTTVPITTEVSTTTKSQTTDKETTQETTTAKTTSETTVETSTSVPFSDMSTDNPQQNQLYVESKQFVRQALGLCLTNHSFVTMRSVLSVSQCAFICSRRHTGTECFSFNYYVDERYCELNEGTTRSSVISSYERIESCQHFQKQGTNTFGGS